MIKMIKKVNKDKYLQSEIHSPLQTKINQLGFAYLNNNKLASTRLSIIFLSLFKLLYLLHLVAVLQLINKQQTSILTYYITEINRLQVLIGLILSLVYVNKIILIGIAYFSRTQGNQSHKLYSVCVYLVKYFHVLSQLDLIISSFMLIINLIPSLPNFIVSACLCLFSNIYLQNYTDRKNSRFCSSSTDSFVMKCFQICIIIINSILLQLNSELSLCLWLAISSSILLGWYVKYGHRMYLHQLIKNVFMATVSMFLAIAILFILNTVVNQDFLSQQKMFQFGISFGFIEIFFIYCSKKRSLIQQLNDHVENSDIKSIDLMLSSLIGDNVDQDQLLLLFGIFDIHEVAGCTNPKCSTFQIDKTHVYDPILKYRVSVRQEGRDKQSSLRFYLRCLYQRQIVLKKRDKNVLIDYCEFILSEFGNVFTLYALFLELQRKKLNIFQLVRLNKMRSFLKQRTDLFNRQIFDGKLQLQEIITAEDHFQNIQSNTRAIIRKNIQIWSRMRSNSVNLTELKENVSLLFDLRLKTDQQWGIISRHLNIQKKWFQFYINYSFYIRNDKIKNKLLEECTFKQIQTPYIQANGTYSNGVKATLLNSAFLFDKNTFYLRTFMEQKQMFISNVSFNFQKITKFTKQQIINGQLSIILDSQLKQIHNQSVLLWLEEGHSSNQKSYPIKFTKCLDREGREIPVIKFYKIFVNLESQHLLEFVALIKVNRKQMIQIAQNSNSSVRSQLISAGKMDQKLIQSSDFALKNQNNIFLKDDTLQAKKDMKEIQQTKKALRILTIALIFLIFILSVVTKSDAENLNNYSIQYLNFLNMYRFPMALVKNYMKYFLNVGNQTKVMNQIGSATKSFQGFASAPLTLQTLFDVSLNVPAMYYPNQNNSVNKGQAYNQIDLFYLIASSISSLSKFPINRTGSDFIQLNQYLKPSYDKIINNTKNVFHSSFQGIFSLMHMKQLAIAFIQGFIFLLIMVFIYYRVYTYFSKMKQAMIIIIQFNSNDMLKISSYWRKLALHFLGMIAKSNYDGENGLKTKKQILQTVNNEQLDTQGQLSNNLNKKGKHVYQTSQQKKKMKKNVTIIVICMLLIICMVLSIQVISYYTISDLAQFQLDGFYFLQYYPATSILGHAILQKYYSYVYPKEVIYDPSRFADAVQDMRLIGQYSYIGNLNQQNSLYFQKRKNYLFGSPCNYGPNVLVIAQTTLAKCLTMSNRTFSSGMTTFVRSGYFQVYNYINGFNNLTVAQLDELSTSLTMTAYFITDAITTWAQQFSDKIKAFEAMNYYFCLMMGILLALLHLTVLQCLMFRGLQRDYKFMRHVFNYIVPEYILVNQKVIKQKFVMDGILEQI